MAPGRTKECFGDVMTHTGRALTRKQMTALTWICMVWLLCWLKIASSVDTDIDCDDCYLYGPSRNSELTLYFYPRNIEDATQRCLDAGGWLFVDHTVFDLSVWVTIVTSLWGPILKEPINILSGARTLYRGNDTQEFDWLGQMCDPGLLDGHTNDSRYWANVDLLSEFSNGQHVLRPISPPAGDTTMSFICAKEKAGCTFSKLENMAYDSPADLIYQHRNVTECLARCQLMEDKDSDEQCWLVEYENEFETCSLFLISAKIVNTSRTERREGITLYVKQCYEPFVNFQKGTVDSYYDYYLYYGDEADPSETNTPTHRKRRSGTVPSDGIQPPEEMFPLEKYCDIEPSEDPYNSCPPDVEYEDTSFSPHIEPPQLVETTTDIIDPTPSSSFDLTSSTNFDEDIVSSYTPIVTSSYIDEDEPSDDMLFTSEPSFSMTSAVLTPAKIPETTPFPQKQTTADVMTSVEPTPTLDMTSVYQTNSTEISMLTKTSIANATATATMEATECDCTCIIHVTSTRDPQEFMSSIIHELEIDKKNTSKNRRRYRSINMDRRWQTLSVGYLGVAMFFLIFGGIVLMDMGTLIQDFKMMLHNIRQSCGRGHVDPAKDTTPTTAEPERPRIDLRDLDRYSAIAAEVCPKPMVYLRPQRPGQRPVWTNRDRYDPYVGFRRLNIYNSN